jgi:hypothetical protein
MNELAMLLMLVVEIAMAKITCIFAQTYSANVNEAFYANVLGRLFPMQTKNDIIHGAG